MGEESPDRWSGDVNEAVDEEWTAETTPLERVETVVRTTSEPQYARVISERARVSEPTARTHLKRLVDSGFAEAVETNRGTQYKRSRQAIATSRIAELHRELSRDELVAGIQRLRQRITDLAERFGATGPDDLAVQIEDGNAEEAWDAVAEWRSLAEHLDVATAALALYDFDPDSDGGPQDAAAAPGERGSFATDGTEHSGSSPSGTV